MVMMVVVCLLIPRARVVETVLTQKTEAWVEHAECVVHER